MENYQKVEKNKSDSVLESVLGQNDRWENYLGKKENKMEILIRYPDGQKKMMMFPPDSKLKVFACSHLTICYETIKLYYDLIF